MKHFSNEKLNSKMSHFGAIGFTVGLHKNDKKKKYAYARQHVFAAVFLNLTDLKDLQYNKNMIAMEDIEFLNRIHYSENYSHTKGLIVKCRRFVSVKKKLNHGGVIVSQDQKNVPSPRIVPNDQKSRKRKNQVTMQNRTLSDYFPSPKKSVPEAKVSESATFKEEDGDSETLASGTLFFGDGK
jgi:hypothetical protein